VRLISNFAFWNANQKVGLQEELYSRYNTVYPRKTLTICMKKRPRKKRTSNSKKITDQQPELKPEEIQYDIEKPFDFGGLAERDLKKNLGCG